MNHYFSEKPEIKSEKNYPKYFELYVIYQNKNHKI